MLRTHLPTLPCPHCAKNWEYRRRPSKDIWFGQVPTKKSRMYTYFGAGQKEILIAQSLARRRRSKTPFVCRHRRSHPRQKAGPINSSLKRWHLGESRAEQKHFRKFRGEGELWEKMGPGEVTQFPTFSIPRRRRKLSQGRSSEGGKRFFFSLIHGRCSYVRKQKQLPNSTYC